MKFFIKELIVGCRKGREVLSFTDVNYFYGQMGAGKSTISRLIDFCVGGDLELTPALQSEFIYATLTIEVEGRRLVIRREVNATQVTANFGEGEDEVVLSLPARKPDGVVLPETKVEVLSDLIFHLAGKVPPLVRRSKLNEDSDLSRLSFRDLLWYCYLEQDNIDSDFFHLDSDAHPFKRLKSRDVLRYIVGFHQEHVSELEVQLEDVRLRRLACESAAESMQEAMTAANIATSLELEASRRDLNAEADRVAAEIATIRSEKRSERPHGIETLQAEGRLLSDQIAETNRALSELSREQAKHIDHKNELTSLSARWLRSKSARIVIEDVEFVRCPSCVQDLPSRPEELCPVCGQIHKIEEIEENDRMAERDLLSRTAELNSLIEEQNDQIGYTSRYLSQLMSKKRLLDDSISKTTAEYDSSYLAAALELERRLSALKQQLADLEKLEQLAARVLDLQSKTEVLLEKESRIRASLKTARAAAEKDTGNLKRLRELFLDCLVRSKIAGFAPTDIVEIRSPHFLPEVMPKEGGELAFTSFGNIGSGGKKTLFKCCFALAVHRLVHEIGGLLPRLLIIDSPMKNISERENFEQFEGFHKLLYELAAGELRELQFILIDKEMLPPPEDFDVSFHSRHMTPTDPDHPPLIGYYRGQ
jgi:hypothetical protein